VTQKTDWRALCEGLWWFFVAPVLGYGLIERTVYVETPNQEMLLMFLAVAGIAIYAWLKR
jgi:hypothetical protein